MDEVTRNMFLALVLRGRGRDRAMKRLARITEKNALATARRMGRNNIARFVPGKFEDK